MTVHDRPHPPRRRSRITAAFGSADRITRSLRAAVVVVACAASATVVLGSGHAQAAPYCPNQNQCTDTFTPTNSMQSWVAPQGVTSVTVLMFGAQGGTGPTGVTGGLGARITATLPVIPGTTYRVLVGGRGSDIAGDVQAGGFGGGGKAADCASTERGAGGGGSSQFGEFGTTVSLIAAGGGGGGGGAYGSNGGRGGTGGASGADGAAGDGGRDGSDGGGGGRSGTTGGTGGGDSTGSGQSGHSGTRGQGGDGASGLSSGCGNLHPGGGGGGGGGYQGGGGGGEGENGHVANLITPMRGGGGGGGGGGSNFVGSAATGVTVTDGLTAGSGNVFISYINSIHFTSPAPTITYSENMESYRPTATATSGLPVKFDEADHALSQPCFAYEGEVIFKHVGRCVIFARAVSDGANWPAPPAEQVIDIAPGKLNIMFNSTPPPRPVVGDTYEVNVGYALTDWGIEVRATGNCTISTARVVTFTHAGDCTVTADQPGDGNYIAAPQITQTITVSPKAEDLDTEAPAFADTTPVALTGTVGTVLNRTFAVTGLPKPVVTVVDPTQLPPGTTIAIDAVTGVTTLSGNPTAAGNYTFTLIAVNGVGTPATLDVTVAVDTGLDTPEPPTTGSLGSLDRFFGFGS